MVATCSGITLFADVAQGEIVSVLICDFEKDMYFPDWSAVCVEVREEQGAYLLP